MGRYIGPTCKLSRREGSDLMLKSGVRLIDSKCKLDTPPGQHGKGRARLTDYGVQLRMKQMVRRYYGVFEKPFRNYYKSADKQAGATGDNLLRLLESRLDNVVYRMGFASTRSEGRQLVSHKSILVNGDIVNVASYQVKPGDVVSIRERCKSQLRIESALQLRAQREDTEWLSVDSQKKEGVFNQYPERDQLPVEFKVNLIVELYSK